MSSSVSPPAPAGTGASDYLRQRARDRVDWQPWPPSGERPVLLCIGYSGSPWCERMGRESFRDPAVAGLINRRFTPVCIDRERRPDLDRVYQNAFRRLNGRPGGWPLTAVLTPDDRLPFFAAGYLAAAGRDGFPGFAELLHRLADFYRDREDEVREQNRVLAAALAAGPSRHGASGYSLRPGVLEDAAARLQRRFDPRHGGFDPAPKFVRGPMLQRLLRHYLHSRRHGRTDTRAGFIVKFTLEKIGASPLHAADGGFYRYADGADWSAPQPERPLIDNALLLKLYADTAHVADSARCRELAASTAAWLLRALRAADGGFCLNLIDRTRPSGRGPNGRSPPPLRDEQQRVAGNGLAIAALAAAGRALADRALIDAAGVTLDGVRERCWRDGRLYAYTGMNACLDDHALLLDGVLELLQCRWRRSDFTLALALAEELLEHFQEPGKKGGFYDTRDDHERLIERPRPIFDDALPALNGLVAEKLLQIGHWTRSLRHLLAAERALKNAWPSLERSLTGCCGILLALESYFFPPWTLVLRAETDALTAWRDALEPLLRGLPRCSLLAIPNDAGPALPGLLGECAARAEPVAYLCRGASISPPLSEPAALRAELHRAATSDDDPSDDNQDDNQDDSDDHVR